MLEKIEGKRENVYNHTKRWNQKYLSNEITIRKIDLSKKNQKKKLSNQLRLQIHIMTIMMNLVHEPTRFFDICLELKKKGTNFSQKAQFWAEWYIVLVPTLPCMYEMQYEVRQFYSNISYNFFAAW